MKPASDGQPRRRVQDLLDARVLLINDGYRAKNSELSDDGLPFARAGNIDGGFNFTDADRFPEKDLSKVGDKISQPWDVVFTSKGTVGRFAFVSPQTPRFVYSPQLCFWRSLDTGQIDPRYLFYWMQAPDFRRQYESVKGQTDMADYVSLRDQRRMEVVVPHIDDQRAIARVLGALDDKIEENRRMNETLEETARAIFKSWFVDFDPVRAKAKNRRPEGMDAETAALFPDGFEESEIGEVPRGWRPSRAGQEFRITMGQSPPGSTYNEGGDGLPFFQGRADFGWRFPSRRVHCTAPTRYADPGDTLVSVRAPVGDINVAVERCAIGRGVASVRHRSGSFSYTYYSMGILRPAFDRFEAEGTVFGSIGRKEFENLEIVAPPAPIVAAYDRVCGPQDAMIRSNDEESRTLAVLREALLPRLLSGEVRATDADV